MKHARRVASIAALILLGAATTERFALAQVAAAPMIPPFIPPLAAAANPPAEAEVTADVASQFYDVRSPTGQTVLQRRRLTGMVGVAGYNLLDPPPGDTHAPSLDIRGRLRYDADYGVGCGETAVVGTSATCVPSYGTFVPGAAQSGVDLMYFYVEGRRFFNGLVGFRVGRQYQTDVLGWWSFDGGELSVTTPFYVKGEIYGGLEERGGLPLSTGRFEADGVFRGDRTNFDPSAYPYFQPAAIAPAIGAAIETTGVTWIHGRLVYRRVYDTGGSNVTEFASGLYAPAAYSGVRTSTDRLGYAVDTSFSNVGGFKGGLIYDFYRAELTSAFADLDAYLGPKVTVGLNYDYYVPSFDADSIWNFFAGEPHNDFGVRATVDADRHLSVAANAHARMFTVQTAEFTTSCNGCSPSVGLISPPPAPPLGPYFPTNGHPFDEGAEALVRWRNEETRLGLTARGDFGDEGDRVGADVTAQQLFETRYVVAGRLGVWTWDDKLQPDRSTTSVQAVGRLGYRFMPRSEGAVEGEWDANRLIGQRFRVLLLLSLGLSK